MQSCIFEKSNFRGANLSKACIVKCKFIECKIDQANFFDTVLYEVDFYKSDLKSFCETNNLHKSRLIYNPKNLDAELLEKIKKEKPSLLEKSDCMVLNRSTGNLVIINNDNTRDSNEN